MRRIDLAAILCIIPLAFVQSAYAECVPHEGCYGAVAVGIWNGPDGVARVTARITANASAGTVARFRAMSSCNSEGHNCKILGTFGTGQCSYISLGSAADSVGYGYSPDKAEALKLCRDKALNCREPVGACNDDDDE